MTCPMMMREPAWGKGNNNNNNALARFCLLGDDSAKWSGCVRSRK